MQITTLRVPIVSAVLGLLASACSGDSTPVCEQPVKATSVEMGDFYYEPTCVAVETDVTLTVDNPGAVPHTFTVVNTSANIDVAAGESGQLDLMGVAPGLYQVICTYHSNMQAALQVA
jgi:plastocyanin